MATVEKSIDVNVPVSTAYNQWTQFEEFPRFMEGVKEVRQKDDDRLQWCAEIAGKEERWEAEITSQVADQRIAGEHADQLTLDVVRPGLGDDVDVASEELPEPHVKR